VSQNGVGDRGILPSLTGPLVTAGHLGPLGVQVGGTNKRSYFQVHLITGAGAEKFGGGILRLTSG